MHLTFSKGMIAGALTLAVAVPLAAEVAGAASSSSGRVSRGVPSQACVQAMASLAKAQLTDFDAVTAKHKTALQARVSALDAAAALSDDAARKAALEKLREDKPENMQPSDAVQAAMAQVRTACGGTMMRFGGHGMMDDDKGMGGMMDDDDKGMGGMMDDDKGMGGMMGRMPEKKTTRRQMMQRFRFGRSASSASSAQ